MQPITTTRQGIQALGDVASVEEDRRHGYEYGCVEQQGQGHSRRRLVCYRSAPGLARDELGRVVAQQPRLPFGAEASNQALENSEVDERSPQGGGGVATHGGDGAADDRGETANGRHSHREARRLARPSPVHALRVTRKNGNHSHHRGKKEMHEDYEGHSHERYRGELRCQQPHASRLPSQSRCNRSLLPLGAYERCAQEQTQDGEQGAGPENDRLQIDVLEARVGHRVLADEAFASALPAGTISVSAGGVEVAAHTALDSSSLLKLRLASKSAGIPVRLHEGDSRTHDL